MVPISTSRPRWRASRHERAVARTKPGRRTVTGRVAGLRPHADDRARTREARHSHAGRSQPHQALDDVEQAIRAKGGDAVSVVSDLSDVTSVRRAAVEIAALGLPIAGLQPSSRSAISDRHVRAVTDTFELVATEEDNYPARTMCQWLVVSTSGFYDWYRRPSSSGPAGTPLWTPRHQPPPDLMMCTAPHRRLRSAPRRRRCRPRHSAKSAQVRSSLRLRAGSPVE